MRLIFGKVLKRMRVQVGNVKTVAPQEHGDLITVLESAQTNSLHGGVLFEEGNAKSKSNSIPIRAKRDMHVDFEVATGDKFKGPITGIVGYSYPKL